MPDYRQRSGANLHVAEELQSNYRHRRRYAHGCVDPGTGWHVVRHDGGGGANSTGTIFKVQPDGGGFTILYSFSPCPYPEYLNGDGDNPGGGVALSGGRLYGATIAGGTNGGGTVFAVNTDDSGFTTLFTFSAPPSINA